MYMYEVAHWCVQCISCLKECHDDHHSGIQGASARFDSRLKNEGWLYTDKGWICPECAKKVTP